jgi:hypothetical protein
MRLLKREEVSDKTGLQKSAIYNRMAEGTFPKPVRGGAENRGSGIGNASDSTPRSPPQARSRDSKPETLRKLLIGDLRRICRDRWGVILPDDDAGRDDLDLLLRLHAVAPKAAEKKMRNESPLGCQRPKRRT